MRRRKIFGFGKINKKMNRSNQINYNRNTNYEEEISLGSTGEKVYKIQNMLTGILDKHNTIPAIIVDGNYGQETKNAIMKFQEIMGIAATGVVDKTTLMELEKEYNFASKESREDTSINMNTKQGFYNSKYNSKIIGIGSSGENVIELQSLLNKLSEKYNMIPKLEVDGKFGSQTENSVKIFQGMFNLPTDGIVGKYTWTALYDADLGNISPKESDEDTSKE